MSVFTGRVLQRAKPPQSGDISAKVARMMRLLWSYVVSRYTSLEISRRRCAARRLSPAPGDASTRMGGSSTWPSGARGCSQPPRSPPSRDRLRRRVHATRCRLAGTITEIGKGEAAQMEVCDHSMPGRRQPHGGCHSRRSDEIGARYLSKVMLI
jgi:hypothetical protein